MVSARGVLRHEGFGYALDNGAWTAHQIGETFDAPAFTRAIDKLGAGADFIVVPDIVEGGLPSLDFSMAWIDELMTVGPRLLIAVQDGMTPRHLTGVVSDKVGIFVGGSTDWKLSTLMSWGRFARSQGLYLHVGRVNTCRRIAHCAASSADSFDGSSVSRFYKTLSKLDSSRRQMSWRM